VKASLATIRSSFASSIGLLVSSSALTLLAPSVTLASAIAPLLGTVGAVPPAPWVFAGLPGQTLPATQFVLEQQGGATVLKVQTAASYGNLVQALNGLAPGQLSWRWRVDKPLSSADLRSRQGDDVALKVCALFAMPRAAVPFVEQQLLRLAESRAGQSLPTATICYAWDPSWPEGTVVPNAYSRRVRYLTLGTTVRAWQTVRRDLARDFIRAFGEEATSVPGLVAISIGADADNTQGSSLGFVADLELTPGAAP
jgi:hypothetical protein